MRLWTTADRLAALQSYDIIDTPIERSFEDVVEIACALTGAPVALISFVEEDRQWFKAERGSGLTETPISDSFCAHALSADVDVLLIADARQDPRTRDMSIVTGPPGVRAYAGVVLRTPEGTPIGTVCVLDVEPRAFPESAVSSLQALARQVMTLLELRRGARERQDVALALRDVNSGRELAMQAARLGRWDHRPQVDERFYDARAREILGVEPTGDISTRRMLARIHPEDRARVMASLEAVQLPTRVGSFREEFRIQAGEAGDWRWASCIGRTLFENDVCTRFFGVMEDVTERRAAEELRGFLTAELNHRVKNILTLAQSVSDATLRTAPDLPSAREKLGGRLRALGHAHDLLLAQSWSPAQVADVVHGALDGAGLDLSRVEAEGPPVSLGSRAAMQLQLALHELGTNAAKYGAFSNDTGKVSVRWSTAGKGREAEFRLEWSERGGPPVVRPSRTGFGARVIERATAAAFRGEVELEYAPGGLRWTVIAPLAGLREGDAAEPSPDRPDQPSTQLNT